MDYVHFHCKNCNSATPEMYNVKTILNITCIEELRKIINSNLVTHVRYNYNCKNCAKIKNESIFVDNYKDYYCHDGFYIFPKEKLIAERGLFSIDHNGNYFKKIKNSFYYNEKEFLDLIQGGSLFQTILTEQAIGTLNKIKEKFYEINLVQIVHETHFYLIERPTLTKPARKNNLNN